MGRRMFVLGTDHALQGAEKLEDSKKICDPDYDVLVRYRVQEYYIDYIFEEVSGRGPTTAGKMQRPGLGYLDVDPNEAERKALQIPESTLLGESFEFYEKNDALRPDPSPRALYNQAVPVLRREEVWLKRINNETFTNGLMICGAAHTFSAALRLGIAGFSVDVIIYLPFAKLAQVSACSRTNDPVVDPRG